MTVQTSITLLSISLIVFSWGVVTKKTCCYWNQISYYTTEISETFVCHTHERKGFSHPPMRNRPLLKHPEKGTYKCVWVKLSRGQSLFLEGHEFQATTLLAISYHAGNIIPSWTTLQNLTTTGGAVFSAIQYFKGVFSKLLMAKTSRKRSCWKFQRVSHSIKLMKWPAEIIIATECVSTESCWSYFYKLKAKLSDMYKVKKYY